MKKMFHFLLKYLGIFIILLCILLAIFWKKQGMAFPSMQRSGKLSTPTMTWIGHASIKLKSVEGDVIYVDPYYPGDYSEPADYILVTHGHDDHNKINLCTKAKDCQIITWKDALTDGKYASFEFDHLKIDAVPSGQNSNHPKSCCVGYIITIDGISVYHAGDTSMSEDKNEIVHKKIDYALYPVDGKYNMDADEASEVADLVGASHNIPFHGNGAATFKQCLSFHPSNKMLVFQGETVDLRKE